MKEHEDAGKIGAGSHTYDEVSGNKFLNLIPTHTYRTRHQNITVKGLEKKRCGNKTVFATRKRGVNGE